MAQIDREDTARRMEAAKKMERDAGIKEIRSITKMSLEDSALLYDVETGRSPDGDVEISD